MRLVVLGCSGSVSGPESASSAYLVEADDGERTWRVLLDLGSGAFGQLLRYCDPATVDAVLLSHLHADHMVDMAAMHVYLRYGPQGPYPPVPVHGPAETGERIGQVCGNGECIDGQFRISPWQPGVDVHVGPLRITVVEVDHPVTAYAMRIEGPSERGNGTRVLTYSGDTDACAGLDQAAAGADLFLCEAAFSESCDVVRGIHLTGRRAGEAATRADAGRLVLTHVQPWVSSETVLAEALTEFSGPVDLAEPGATWIV
ncbi:MBL fold metallo-hydrolase [Ruania alba]|uniref:Ribonuclease BN, tRNA processing enzyme n=1 Tax=Ruania alba TaxID=648782 RepID=A0A1H5D9I9_9MICO|nr:MBL fold metallo-hydrolase [Ruania alba]SED75502.1 Ribonuclease BN, tRNA processing enzyme [Ruania alba]